MADELAAREARLREALSGCASAIDRILPLVDEPTGKTLGHVVVDLKSGVVSCEDVSPDYVQPKEAARQALDTARAALAGPAQEAERVMLLARAALEGAGE